MTTLVRPDRPGDDLEALRVHVAEREAVLDARAADTDRLTRELVSRAEQWCGGRLVSALEGGYAPDRLGEAAVVHLRALA